MTLTIEKAREEIAKYGAALGRVEPILRGVLRQQGEIALVMDTLRAEGRYDLADRLRGVVREMDEARAFVGMRSAHEP